MEGASTKQGLLWNLAHAHLSNVKQSLYVVDETRCESRQMRNLVINWNIEEMLQSKIYW
jgi:hypothetical protein